MISCRFCKCCCVLISLVCRCFSLCVFIFLSNFVWVVPNLTRKLEFCLNFLRQLNSSSGFWLRLFLFHLITRLHPKFSYSQWPNVFYVVDRVWVGDLYWHLKRVFLYPRRSDAICIQLVKWKNRLCLSCWDLYES